MPHKKKSRVDPHANTESAREHLESTGVQVLKDSLWYRPRTMGQPVEIARLRDWSDGSWTLHTTWDNVQYFSPASGAVYQFTGSTSELVGQRAEFLDSMFVHPKTRRKGGELPSDHPLPPEIVIPEDFVWQRL